MQSVEALQPQRPEAQTLPPRAEAQWVLVRHCTQVALALSHSGLLLSVQSASFSQSPQRPVDRQAVKPDGVQSAFLVHALLHRLYGAPAWGAEHLVRAVLLQSLSLAQVHTLFVVSQVGPVALPEQSVLAAQPHRDEVLPHLAPHVYTAEQSVAALQAQTPLMHLAPPAPWEQSVALRHCTQVRVLVSHRGLLAVLQSASFWQATQRARAVSHMGLLLSVQSLVVVHPAQWPAVHLLKPRILHSTSMVQAFWQVLYPALALGG